MPDDSSAHSDWKQKYLQTLDDLERREREWSEAESVLRLAVSRAGLAGQGYDERLDQSLQAVRDAVRGDLHLPSLKTELDRLGQILRELESEQDGGGAPPAGELMLRLLEGIEVPKGLRRKAKAVRKSLEGDPAPEAALSSMNGFIDEVIAWVSTEEEAAVAGTADAPGPAQSEADEPPERLAAHALTETLQEEVPALDLGATRAEVAQIGCRADLDRLVRRIVRALREPVPAAPVFPVHEALVQLIDRLQLPDPHGEQARRLSERLAGGLEDADVMGAVAGIADLVSEARLQVQEEKRALEAFLQQLTDRLQELDRHVVDSSQRRREAQQRRRDFNDKLDDQVREIGDSVERAVALDDLKTHIQHRIDTLQAHLERHRAEESEREAQAEREIQQLTERLQTMESEAGSLRERVQRERRLALRDPLTGIPNRLAFDERMAQEFVRWKRYQRPLAVAVWDVDRFKRINDGYGHKAGDRVLTIIARLFADTVRETDFVARYGGEEFVLLMPETDIEGARIVTEKLRRAVESLETHFRGEPVLLTISAGLTLLRDGDTPESAFERADRALYRAKAEGRNRCLEA